MIIVFKLRTLDSQNVEFEVDDQLTVREFKEVVKERMGVDPTLQRLIFAGKVLGDDTKLAGHNLNGMVVHMVARPPPNPEHRQLAPDLEESQRRQAASRSSRLRSVPANITDTVGRLSNLRRLIREICTSLNELEAHVRQDNPLIVLIGGDSENAGDDGNGGVPMETEEIMADSNVATEGVAGPNVEADDSPDEDSDVYTENGDRAVFPENSPEYTEEGATHRNLSLDLSCLIARLNDLQLKFSAYVPVYSAFLNHFNFNQINFTEAERQHTQCTVYLIMGLMHSFAHAYHTVSDIIVMVRNSSTQLTCLHNVMRPPLPMQTQINVSQMPNRSHAPTNQPSGPNNQQNDQSATNLSDTPQNSNQTGAVNPQAGTSRTPDPITYQVEIETRVPIAFAVDNGLIGNLAQLSQNAGQNLDPTTQGNIRQGLESLLREMTQNGVQTGLEVLSMENLSTLMENNTAGVGPNMVNLSGHIQIPLPPNVGLSQSPQAPGQASSQATNQGAASVTTNTTDQAGRTPVSRARLSDNTPTQPGQNQPTTPQTGPRTRQAVIRNMLFAERLPLHPILQQMVVYDMYLPCSSFFARTPAQRRREQSELFIQLRMRNRETAQNFENLGQVAENFTQNTINTILSVINEVPATRASYFTAFMTSVARQLYTPEVMEPLGNLPGLIPSEFPRIHALLREGLCQFINIDETVTRDRAEVITGLIVAINKDSLDRLNSLSFINRQYNLAESIQALLYDRMPAIIACIVNSNENEIQIQRFYDTIGQFFMDMCALVTRLCTNNVEGLRVIFSISMDEYVRSFPVNIQPDIITLCLENYYCFKRHYNGYNRKNILDAVNRYLRPILGEVPENLLQESKNNNSAIPTESSNSRINEDEKRDSNFSNPDVSSEWKTISDCSPAAYLNNISSEWITDFDSSPVQRPNVDFLQSTPDGSLLFKPSLRPQHAASSSNPRSDDPSSIPEPSTSRSPFLSASNKKDIKESQDKQRLLVAAAQPFAGTKKKITKDNNSGVSRMLSIPQHLTGRRFMRSPSTRGSLSNPTTAPSTGSPNTVQTSCSVSTFQAGLGQTNSYTTTAENRRSSEAAAGRSASTMPGPVSRHFTAHYAKILALDSNQTADQEPASDAYLSGSPARLRRAVRQQRPPTDVNKLFRIVLQETSPGSSSPADDASLLQPSLRGHVGGIIADRATHSRDFSPRRSRATVMICSNCLRQRANQSESTDESEFED